MDLFDLQIAVYLGNQDKLSRQDLKEARIEAEATEEH